MGYSTTTWVLIIGIPIAIAVAVFLFWRSRPPKAEEILYFRCPGCKRRLKYRPRQIGHKGMCSNCKDQFTFPGPSPAGKPY
jgi:hypothetical protein